MKNFWKHVGFILFLFLFFIWWWTKVDFVNRGSVRIYDRNGELLYEKGKELGSRDVVKIDDVSKDLIKVLILTEDERFLNHGGVDVLAVIRAVKDNFFSQKIVSGASTIDQQVARYLIIDPYQQPKFSVLRKIREALIAERMNWVYEKEDILEMYINMVYLGRNTYGVEAASHLYFGKSNKDLSYAEMAMLAGMIANPSSYDPIEFSDNAKKRRDDILKRMFESDLISEEVFKRAVNEKLPEKINNTELIAPHFSAMVLDEVEPYLCGGDNFWERFFQRMKVWEKENVVDCFSGSVRVDTSLDKYWYMRIREIASLYVDRLSRDHDLSNAAVVMIDNKNGEVVSLLGGVDFFDEELGGENNMAIALRQPGSALKPVVYAAAFEKGLATTATMIDDRKKVYDTIDGGGYIPNNYDGRFRGPVLVRESLGSSYNMPAVEMLSMVGIKDFLDLSHRMGIKDMKEVDRYDLSLALGGGEVKLLDLTNVFATFARGGDYKEVKMIKKIEDESGKILEFDEEDSVNVIDEKVAYLITDILKDPKARIPSFGEKNDLLLPFSAAAKTGTTTDWHDNWTIGYTPEYTVGVWVGNNDNHPMKDITGITGAGPIWHDVMMEIYNFQKPSEFVAPEGIVSRQVCAADGLLPVEGCINRYIELFISGTEPVEYSSGLLKKRQVQIVNPKDETVFEVGAPDEVVVFELTKGVELGEVRWVLNGDSLVCENDCAWEPEVGDYNLKVFVDGVEIDEVEFSVVSK